MRRIHSRLRRGSPGAAVPPAAARPAAGEQRLAPPEPPAASEPAGRRTLKRDGPRGLPERSGHEGRPPVAAGPPVGGHAPTSATRFHRHPSWRTRCQEAMRHSALGRGWRRGIELELLNRSMGFAALGFVTLAPLLIVVAAADPWDGEGFAGWVVDGLGLTRGQAAVQALFTSPGRTLGTTTAISLVVLAVFGVSFGAAVQTAFERIWELRPAHWRMVWRRLVFLAVLVAYLFFTKESTTLLRDAGIASVAGTAVRLGASILFFWWMQRLLLSGRVGWLALLPGAVLIVGGLLGLRVFSTLVFSPLIVSNAVSYGAVGTVLIVQSWLIGVGFVIYSGCLAGRIVDEELLEVAGRRRNEAAARRARGAVADSAPARHASPPGPEQAPERGADTRDGDDGGPGGDARRPDQIPAGGGAPPQRVGPER